MKLLKNLGMRRSKSGKSKYSIGLFICPCCKQEIIRPLNARKSTHCGCMNTENLQNMRVIITQHGDTIRGSKYLALYQTWADMKTRCKNPRHKLYERYGGRGIEVYYKWKSYSAFKEWALKNGWARDLTIDRINVNGNYEPCNCRFITSGENSRNKSTTKLNWNAVNYIRELYLTKLYTQVLLGRMFKVTGSTINYIVLNKTWKKNT